MLLEDGLTRRRVERRHAAQHLIEDGGECIDVRLVGHRRLTDLLGREVLRRRLRGDEGLHRFRVAQAGQLHVHQLDASVLEHHHVAGAERAVDEAHAVKRLHGSPEVERQAEHGADGERVALRQDLAESATLDALHRHEGPAVLGLTERQHRSEEHTSELQSRLHLVCRLLLEKKKKTKTNTLACFTRTRHSIIIDKSISAATHATVTARAIESSPPREITRSTVAWSACGSAPS